MTLSPFIEALGSDFGRLAPAVRGHLGQPAGRSLLSGSVRRAWRRGGPLGWFLARALRLDFGAIAPASAFEVRNELLAGNAMLWRRTLRTGRATVDAFGVVRWDARHRALVDSLGKHEAIEVELVPAVEGDALALASRRQWLRVLGLRIRLPRALFGSARVREWEEPLGRIALSLTLSHAWLGEYAGYEAAFEEAR